LAGIVYIAGAGCGNLITEFAKKLIEEVDVIIHDELLGEKILELIEKSNAVKINAGKRAGKHRLKQEEINNLLVKFAKEGKKVLRLKAGDPFIFGRGGEEMEYLAENGVNFSVVPGVSSAMAAPACAGIPVTHRKFDPAVVFITGTQAEERLNWKALAELNATIVVLMGMHNLRKNVRKLIENGKSPDTPAAIVQWGCCRKQRVICSRLKEIADVAEMEGIGSPAVLVVGNVVSIREKVKDFLNQTPFD
jgi:uroporphyrin-III C-methyltransferase